MEKGKLINGRSKEKNMEEGGETIPGNSNLPDCTFCYFIYFPEYPSR